MIQTTIITAASEKYASSLFSLIGSLNCNWPNHPKIVVYDIGLNEKSLTFLKNAMIEVRTVPAFCAHWRSFYTWKIWCINEIETENVIYMDAGICVLDNLDEIVEEINLKGYFIVPNYQFLDWEASNSACEGCDVKFGFRIGKGTVAGNLMGFKKDGIIKEMLKNALAVSMIEKNIKATHIKHKFDQAILSLLIYKLFPNPVFFDGFIYLGWESPSMIENQKIWVHRRGMLKKDSLEFKKRMLIAGNVYLPKARSKYLSFIRTMLYRAVVEVKKTIIKTS